MKRSLLSSLAVASLLASSAAERPARAATANALSPQRVALDFHTDALAGSRGNGSAIDPISGTVAFAVPDTTGQKTIVAFYRLADGAPISHAAVPGCSASSQPQNRIDWVGTAVSIVAEPEAGAFVIACSHEADYAIHTKLVAYDATSRAVIAQRDIVNQGYPSYVPDALMLEGASTTDVIMNGTVALDPRTLANLPMSGQAVVFTAGGSQYIDRGNGVYANLGSAPIPNADKIEPFSGDPSFAVLPWLRETVYADAQALRFAKIGGDETHRTVLSGAPAYEIDVDDRKHETFALGVGKGDDMRFRRAQELVVLGDDHRVLSTCPLPKGTVVKNDRGPVVIDADGTLAIAATDRILILDGTRRHVARTIPLAVEMGYDTRETTLDLPGRAAIARLSVSDALVIPVAGTSSKIKRIEVEAFS